MPYVYSEGIRIYYEVEGQGPPLVLAHGGSDSLAMWRRTGYADALRDDFRLILFDARGHGLSDKPHKVSDYGTKMADDVLAVLNSLEIPKAHFYGYSLGAKTGFTLAASHAERFHSFILGGMSPYGFPETMVEAVNQSIAGFRLLLTSRNAYIEWMEQLLKRSLTPQERSEFLNKDAQAFIAMQTALLEMPPLTDEQLANISVPCLLYCGDLDPFHEGAQESVKHMQRAAFISLPGFSHVTALLRSDLVIPFVKAFLFNVSQR